jgi:hypothetical protein
MGPETNHWGAGSDDSRRGRGRRLCEKLADGLGTDPVVSDRTKRGSRCCRSNASWHGLFDRRSALLKATNFSLSRRALAGPAGSEDERYRILVETVAEWTLSVPSEA